MKRDALGREQALKQIREFEIEADSNTRKKFEHGYLRTESVPNRTQLEADRARADHKEFLRRLCEAKRFGAADDCFAVKLRERQLSRSAAGRNHDVLCFQLLRLAVR